MGWQHIQAYRPRHSCQKPAYPEARGVDAGVGSKWQCEECGLVWRIRAFSTKPSDPTDVAIDWVRDDLPTPRGQ